MGLPRVTVLMAVYNGERYLREAVESILGQTFSDFEFVIVDDGSTDRTWQVLTEYAARDPRIVLLQNSENLGLTRSLNKGLHAAQGEYIARQDADDISLPHRLEKQVAVLEECHDVVLVSANIDLMDADGQVWWHPRRNATSGLIAWFLLFCNYLGGHSQVMFRRQAALDLGGYAEDRPCSQDYELWLRLAEVGDVVILPEVLLLYRTHGESVTSRYGEQQKEYSLVDSQRAMARLLGETPDLGEVARLRAFWLGPFPEGRTVAKVHRRLRQLSAAFLADRASRRSADPGLPRALSRQVARRFFVWARVLARSGKPFQAFQALAYALAWHAGGGIRGGGFSV